MVKKVTVKNLVDAGLDLIAVSTIDLDKLDQSSTTKIGTTAIADDAVTYAKVQNGTATDRLLGRRTAGAGSRPRTTRPRCGRRRTCWRSSRRSRRRASAAAAARRRRALLLLLRRPRSRHSQTRLTARHPRARRASCSR